MTGDVVLVDCGSRKVPELGQQLESLGVRCAVVALEDANEHRFDAATGIVISGGPRLFVEEPDLVARFAFVDRVTTAVLGICLGHQAIALRQGAAVYGGAERRGAEQVVLHLPHPLVAGLPGTVTVVADHREGVELPEGFVRLGSSKHYPVEIMASDERRRYGVQFHPEVSGQVGQQLLANFLRIAGG